MSCYFRHMKNILDEAGIKVTPGNKKEIARELLERYLCPNRPPQ